MSLVGPDMQPVSSKDMKEEGYTAGGLRIMIGATPELLLQRALDGAQKMAAQQAAMMAMQEGLGRAIAQSRAQEAATKVADPFAMEPCALAVFMYLAREIEYRDRIIRDMAARLDALDNQTTDLEHPYPISGDDVDDKN